MQVPELHDVHYALYYEKRQNEQLGNDGEGLQRRQLVVDLFDRRLAVQLRVIDGLYN